MKALIDSEWDRDRNGKVITIQFVGDSHVVTDEGFLFWTDELKEIKYLSTPLYKLLNGDEDD